MKIQKNQNILIYSSNFLLKSLDESSVSSVLEYNIRNKDFFEIAVPTRNEFYFTEEHQIEKLILEKNIRNLGRGFRLYIYSKNDKECKNILGDIAVYDIEFTEKSCSMGYKVDFAYKQRGVMLEAMKRTIDYLFDDIGIDSIYLFIIHRNVPSLRFATKLGFRRIGVVSDYIEVMGKKEDHLKLVYTRVEYESKR